jgi:hypothetical protein
MTDEAQQFHVDIDYKNDLLGADALQAHAIGMVEKASIAVQTAANERGLDAGEPLLFNSSTATKGSFHMHYPSLLFVKIESSLPSSASLLSTKLWTCRPVCLQQW